MDLVDLKIFKELYVNKNITYVSKVVHMSQPNISYRLKKIQDELGVKLYSFDGVYHFNEKSKLFFDYCTKVLNGYNITKDRLKNKDTYNISMCRLAASKYQNKLFNLSLASKIFPNIVICSAEIAFENLLEGKSQVIIVDSIDLSSNFGKDIKIVPIEVEKFRFVYNKNCEDDISKVPLIIDQPYTAIGQKIDEYIHNFSNINIIGHVSDSPKKLSIIDDYPAGTFMQEEYLKNTYRKRNIVISDKFHFDCTISMLGSYEEFKKEITSVFLEMIKSR